MPVLLPMLLRLFMILLLTLVLIFNDMPIGELDRSFLTKGGTVDTALALKDATRHKQPVGSGAWISTRGKDDIDALMGKKKRGIFTEHTDRSTIITDLGHLAEQDMEIPVAQVTKKATNDVIKPSTQAALVVPVKPFIDSWEAKAARAEEARKKNRLLNTSLGSLKDVGGGVQSAMTRLNQINSGMAESFTNNHQSFLATQFPTAVKKSGKSLSSMKPPRSGQGVPDSAYTNKPSVDPIPPVKVKVVTN